MNDPNDDLLAELDTPEAAVAEPPKAHQIAVMPDKGKNKTPIAFGERGVQLQTLEDAYRWANVIIGSGLAPKGMTKPETVLVAVQAGMELGFTPMQALQNVVVVNGKPSVYGDAALGLVRGSGLLEEYTEHESGTLAKGDRTWTITVKRKGMTPITRSFSIADAKQARLWGKPGPWSDYPDRMLRYRPLAFVLRDCFSDILKGLPIREEMLGGHEVNGVKQNEVTDARAAAILVED